LSTLRRPSHPGRRKTHFWLLARLYQVGLVTHRVPTKGFRGVPVTSLPPFPSFSGRKNAPAQQTGPAVVASESIKSPKLARPVSRHYAVQCPRPLAVFAVPHGLFFARIRSSASSAFPRTEGSFSRITSRNPASAAPASEPNDPKQLAAL